MTIEKLTAEQYPMLKEVADGFVPDPANSIAIVAKDGEEIVGRVLVVAIPHIEGTWIREDKRNGTLAIRLFRKMEQEVKTLGLGNVFAFIADEKHEEYMERGGYVRVPVTVWRKELSCL